MKRFDDLPDETKEFLADLGKDDIRTLRAGMPVFKAILGFAKVTKWLAIAAIGIFGGVVMLGESIWKIIGWIRG